jgi:hypothetical protein
MRRRQGGYTLVETLVVGLIASLVGGSLVVLGKAGHDVWWSTDAALASQASARAVLNRLTRELRGSSRAMLACPAATAAGWTLQFPVDEDGDEMLESPAELVTYQFDAATGAMTRTDAQGTLRLASGVLEATRTCEPSTGLVRVSLTTRVRSPGGHTAQQAVRSETRARNS